MSVSAHLSPEPERRLWIIHENLRRSVEWADVQIGAMTAFAALQLALIRPGADALGLLVAVPLSLALPLGVFAFFWDRRLPGPLSFLEPPKGRHSGSDSLIDAGDIPKHTQNELVLRLDRYLGGGVTATPYYEDIIAQILARAGSASRKQRLFRGVCALVFFAQLVMLARLLLAAVR